MAQGGAVAEGIANDASSGRLYLSPTALMPPKGTWSFSSSELLLLGLSYSFTDRVAFSVTTLFPVTDDFYWALLNL